MHGMELSGPWQACYNSSYKTQSRDRSLAGARLDPVIHPLRGKQRMLKVLLAASVAVLCGSAFAQDAYPTKKPITLVSPYPDPTLTRLEPGTLLIVVRLP